MSYQEKRTVVSLVSTILITVIYSLVMAQRYTATNPYSAEAFHFWGAFLLILIPVSIVARIVIYIVFSIFNTIITKEKEPAFTDERDKLIELKAARNSLYTFTAGFLLAMGSLVLDMPPNVMFILLICAGLMADVIGETSNLYFYRRGV